ncbi:ABC transporter permease, partial [Gemmatimonas sp.]|uniref:ABC transporter permease n=1 Tax=Gemmatimonas sp. TaxID=1962908 RepID=UPI00391FC815
MIAHIARKERTEMWRDGRFRVAAVALLLLLAVALLTGLTTSRGTARDHDAAQEAMRGFWVNQGAKNPHSAAHYGLWVFKPSLPLSFVDHGVDAYTGVTTWLEAHKQNEFTRRPAMDRPNVARFGEWTAAAVLQLLVPLLIVMLAFPAFAGERETGTLRQLAAIGVPMRTLMLGKAAGIASALAVVLVPATLLG